MSTKAYLLLSNTGPHVILPALNSVVTAYEFAVLLDFVAGNVSNSVITYIFDEALVKNICPQRALTNRSLITFHSIICYVV